MLHLYFKWELAQKKFKTAETKIKHFLHSVLCATELEDGSWQGYFAAI